MTLKDKKQHYLAIKKDRLLSAVISKNNGDFYCLNFFHSFQTIKKLLSHEKNM